MSQANRFNYLQHSFQHQKQPPYECNQRFSSSSLKTQSMPSPCSSGNYRQKLIHVSTQFSPYENKEQNIKQKILLQELTNHNKILTQQIQQFKDMVDKLEVQLRMRSDQFASLNLLRQKEKQLHEQAVRQLKQQMKLLFTKNGTLQQKNHALAQQLTKYQSQITRNEARARSLSAVAANSKQNSQKLLLQITNLLQMGSKNKKKQRQIGKVFNHTFSNITVERHSPKNSVPLPKTSQNIILQQISLLLRRTQKYQQLSQSILQMHHKITGKSLKHQPHELKQIWKWLKQLGHCYNITQKWKKILIDVLALNKSNNQNHDLSIDQVLQKTIVALHGK